MARRRCGQMREASSLCRSEEGRRSSVGRAAGQGSGIRREREDREACGSEKAEERGPRTKMGGPVELGVERFVSLGEAGTGTHAGHAALLSTGQAPQPLRGARLSTQGEERASEGSKGRVAMMAMAGRDGHLRESRGADAREAMDGSGRCRRGGCEA